MADHRNAPLTLNSTVPLAMVATVPTARITQMVPIVKGAERISSALAAMKPALHATVVLLVSDNQGLRQPDGLKDKVKSSL